ncbi:DUF5655 domain-containing protein [Blastococcus tunisiensis]|uniref:DUF5655 domain-containing protein n=1 Tax=Blastococcus tunisiensis TaxID=1798228 RepID=A0A1I2DUX2_9ACTN|nr:DUF5655 domain-containing protein [Blastococcus sp. DSM 46838]SFE84472.1 hypothetical protein SAMN05216574_106141 [Blastococcus sp. DSM 46838]
MTPEAFFAGRPVAGEVFERVRVLLVGRGAEVRVSASQVAFRRRRGFAYLWLPDRYLRRPTAEVVLSIDLGRRDPSPRFKEVAHPAPRHWMHHLEVDDPVEIDDEVAAWLAEAADRAG